VSAQPAGFAMTPNAVSRDTNLSVTARLAYVVLDGRQGANPSVRVKLATLAADLGIAPSSTRRVMAELKAAGLVTVTRTGRSSSYALVNAERSRTGTQSAHVQALRVLTGEHSTEKEALEKELSEQASKAKPLAAAAELPDVELELYITLYVEALPEHLRPDESSPKVRTACAQARAHSWTPDALADAVGASVTNRSPRNPPGLAITQLAQLAATPYRETGKGDTQPRRPESIDLRVRQVLDPVVEAYAHVPNGTGRMPDYVREELLAAGVPVRALTR
jgi:DNA-binding transcriptional regulator YhcF (GntR family)